MSVSLRPARPEDACDLTGLALASKASWGYDEAFVEACCDELTITPERIAAERIVVAETGGVLAGFSALAVDGDTADLLDLFVAPSHLRQGIGSRLLDAAAGAARAAGVRRMRIEADPHAEAFYAARGARRIGTAPSGSIPGRLLPLLEIGLEGRSEPPGRPGAGQIRSSSRNPKEG